MCNEDEAAGAGVRFTGTWLPIKKTVELERRRPGLTGLTKPARRQPADTPPPDARAPPENQ
jgi:hypothetical protein